MGLGYEYSGVRTLNLGGAWSGRKFDLVLREVISLPRSDSLNNEDMMEIT